MIDEVRVVRFKRFHDQTFDVSGGTVLLAGPNNSGKTTLLHAISAWSLARTRWRAEREQDENEGRKKSVRKPGRKRRISILPDEFTALPLREINLLWLNRHTAVREQSKGQPRPAPIYGEVMHRRGRLVEESLTIEFYYANEKLVDVRPVRSPEEPEPIDSLPAFIGEMSVVHVPAFSGIGTQEPKHAAGMQNKLVGEGKPGEIVRNLLLEIWEQSPGDAAGGPWKELCGDIERLFQCELLPPQSSPANPYIVCEYRPKLRTSESSTRPPRLDIASAGSGFHQVLLLLSFFYSREVAVLLLDEPDAHLHFILQREVFDHLRNVAQRRRSQLIIGTHAEVLLDDAEPQQIISFVGEAPRRLAQATDKQRLQDAHKTLTSLDLVQADHVGAVLYVEDETDHKNLREWAKVLGNPASGFLNYPYVYPLKGKGNLPRANQHFQSLKLAQVAIRGICILDSDLEPDVASQMPQGLALHVWRRYEIENYLLHPDVVKRFVRGDNEELPFENAAIDAAFAQVFPPGTDWLGDSPNLRQLKGGDLLIDILRGVPQPAGMSGAPHPAQKRDLYMLASRMQPAEIHPDVVQALDRIAEIIPPSVPSIEVNLVPPDPDGLNGGEE